MFQAYQCLAVVLLATSSLAAYCSNHSIGFCAFRVYCSDAIRGVSLPNECRGSVNHPVTVDLTLYDAKERFDSHIEKEFLHAVTSFKASAAWQTTTLSVLNYMPKLEILVLTDDHIENIDGSPFEKLKYLQHLDLTRNNLTDIVDLFQFEDQINSLKRLLLSNNAIQEIPGDTFSELISLKELDLSYNFISDLTEEPFMNLTNLEILRLNNNRIKDLNGAVNNLLNLKHLYLRGNQIQNIDEPSLKIIKHLVTFDVSGNELDNLKPVMFLRHWHHFDGVCKIILSENHISIVPNGTSKELSERYARQIEHKVDVLTELDLSKNEITTVEYNAFQSIVKLTSLDLSNNKLINFIVESDDLKDIKYLNLSCNYLSALFFDSFSSMVYLRNLDLSHNNIDYFPDQTFAKNFNLKYVNVTFNSLKVITNLPIEIFHQDGGILDLSNNELVKVVLPFGKAIRLAALVLNSNKISDAGLVNLEYQSEMKSLQMNKNNIKTLNNTSLKLPHSLTYLDLSCNSIHDIGPSSFHRVTHLRSLYLRQNKIVDIKYGAFQGLTALATLDLSFNGIKFLDSKVLMDLKSLSVLSLRSNGLYYLDYKGWLGHKSDLKVYLEGNNFTCEWLGQALKDFNNGFSPMRPTVMQYTFREVSSKNSMEGIPCIQNESQKLVSESNSNGLADERLLVTNKKILEAVKGQTYLLKLLMQQFNHNLNVIRSTGIRKS